MRATQPSHPPSEPRPIAGRPGADAGPDRANLVQGRVQLIAALLLLLVLVVVPLYLWRRPRAAATDEAKPNASALASAQVADPPPKPADPKTKDGVTVSDAKVIGCHDPGSRRTAPGACDRLPSFESAFAKAILDSASCVPPGTPAGAIAFVADASYSRHKTPIHVKAGREGTTMHSKIATACVADVKRALAATPLDQAHGHARYDIEIDATYAGKR